MRMRAGLWWSSRNRGTASHGPSYLVRSIACLAAAVCLSCLEPAAAISALTQTPAPELEQILDRMMQVDRVTTPKLRDYTSLRKYRLENNRVGKRADMTVRLHFHYPGNKQFEVLEEHGSSIIRNRVLRRMLASEVEASGDALRDATQITPANYSFRLAGTEDLDGRKSYILEATPKSKNTYLFRGRIWVDAEDYAIAKLEGSPAQNPSFWIRRTVFVHRYAKFGPFWLAVSNHSETDALVFGRTDVQIDYFDYRINEDSGKAAGE